jgi:formate dehydrogenase subunit gamma
MTAPDGGSVPVVRFDRSFRALHWAFSIPFTLLLVSGIILALPSFEVLLTHRDVLRSIHLYSAIGLVVLPLVTILVGNRRSLAQDLREIDYWDRLDWIWLSRAFAFWRGGLPPQGRFNAGQKLNTVIVLAASTGFVMTGLLMWRAELFPLWLGDVATQLHDALTVLVTPLVLGHIFMAALNPRTNGALGSIFHGRVDREWVRAHHGRWQP